MKGCVRGTGERLYIGECERIKENDKGLKAYFTSDDTFLHDINYNCLISINYTLTVKGQTNVLLYPCMGFRSRGGCML